MSYSSLRWIIYELLMTSQTHRTRHNICLSHLKALLYLTTQNVALLSTIPFMLSTYEVVRQAVLELLIKLLDAIAFWVLCFDTM